MPTKITLTGSHTRTTGMLSGSTLTRPAAAQARTAITQTAHWKKSRALADLNPKEERAILLSSTWRADGLGGWIQCVCVCGGGGGW